MKKFFATLILIAFAVIMFPVTTSYASQTVNCSWWGKMIHGEYNSGDDEDDTCSWCYGSGDCQTCDGKGYVVERGYRAPDKEVECDDCDGSGKCSHCNGWGR